MAVTEPLIHWPQPLIEILGFVAAFLACGAVGFRYAVLRGLRADAPDAEPTDASAVARTAAARAAGLGLAGGRRSARAPALRPPRLAAPRPPPAFPFVAGTPPVAA